MLVTQLLSENKSLLRLHCRIGDGLTVITNEAGKQVFDMLLTVANINTLLAGKTTHVFTYVFSIQPVGGSVATKPKGMGYDGIINVCVASYG